MQKIVPNVWFDHNAAEAAAFYAEAFDKASVISTEYYPSDGLPEFQAEFAGKELMVVFEIDGYRIIGINAGPEFPVTPALSFLLNFDSSTDHEARAHLDQLWQRLVEGGEVLMPLDAYPHSPHYGWLRDRFGVTWQLMLTNPEGDSRPFITPTMLFCGPAQNRAAEASEYYVRLFPWTRVGIDVRYPAQAGPASPGSVMYTDIEIFGQWFALMDASSPQDYTFSPGVSLMIQCADQNEIDRYWSALSAVPEAEACGWCTDQFGVSWQIVPENLGELMAAEGAYGKLMAMKKIEIADFD